jgi:hypothetical protein
MYFSCSPSLLRLPLLLALERGLADSLSYPEVQEGKGDEAREDGVQQVALGVAEQLVGWCDGGGVIGEVHNGDRLPRGDFESCIVALADRAGGGEACAVGELHRECLPPAWMPSRTEDCSSLKNSQ